MRAQRQAQQPQAFEVLPANWLAVQVFLDCAGQWRRDSNGTPEAIARTQLQASLTLCGVPRKQQPDTFRRVRVMEASAAKVFRKRAEQAAARARNRR